MEFYMAETQFLKSNLERMLYIEEHDPMQLRSDALTTFNALTFTHQLIKNDRPYYKVYPEVFEAVSGTTLDLAMEDWHLPFDVFEIRMPKTETPLLPIDDGSRVGVSSIQVFRHPERRFAQMIEADTAMTYKYAQRYRPDLAPMFRFNKNIAIQLNVRDFDTPQPGYQQFLLGTITHYSGHTIRDATADVVERLVDACPANEFERIADWAWEKSIKLALGVSLLATGSQKILQPDVLSKHLNAFNEMRAKGDTAGCKAIVAKARQKGKFGWNVGKPTDRRLPLSQNPSYPRSEGKGGRRIWGSIRCGHWHKYRVGAGRKTVKIMWVNPTVVRPDLPLRQTA